MSALDFGMGIASSAFNTLGNWLVGRDSMNQQEKHQKNLASYTNDLSQEGLYENALKLPALQKQGLKNAGLNPAALDGQFSQAQAPQQQTGTFSGYSASPMDIVGIMQANSVVALNKAQQDKIKAETRGIDLENEHKERGILLQQSNIEADTALKDAQSSVHSGQAKKLVEETINLKNENKLFTDTFDDRVRLLKAEADKLENESDREKFLAMVAELQAAYEPVRQQNESKVMQSQANANNASAFKSNAEGKRILDLLPFDINKADQEARGQLHVTNMLRKEDANWYEMKHSKALAENDELKAMAKKLEADRSLTDEQRKYYFMFKVMESAAAVGLIKGVTSVGGSISKSDKEGEKMWKAYEKWQTKNPDGSIRPSNLWR